MDNDWIDTTKWILENTCPDCGQLQCPSGIYIATKIIFWVCSNPARDTFIFNSRYESEWQDIKEAV